VKTRTLFYAMVILLICISGCIPMQGANQVSPSATYTIKYSTPTRTATIWQPSHTPRPTSTITLTPSPTFTALPTLNPQDIITRVNQLFYTNGNCEYPCFWGFTPGVTTLQEVQYQLAPITSSSSIDDDAYYVSIPYTIPNFVEMPLAFYFDTDTDIINLISLPYSRSLSESLSTYGVPTNIWLQVQTVGETDGLFVVLDYPQYGLYLSYDWYLYFQIGSVEQHDGVTSIQICPQDLQGDRVRGTFRDTYLYAIENGYSFEDLWHISSGLDTSYYRLQPIEETTYQNAQNFYNAFSIGGDQSCFVIQCDDCIVVREY